jgi:hypothetical protein
MTQAGSLYFQVEVKRTIPMDITPVIPDGYNGPIKQLTCRICKHRFYLTMADYGRLWPISGRLVLP